MRAAHDSGGEATSAEMQEPCPVAVDAERIRPLNTEYTRLEAAGSPALRMFHERQRALAEEIR